MTSNQYIFSKKLFLFLLLLFSVSVFETTLIPIEVLNAVELIVITLMGLIVLLKFQVLTKHMSFKKEIFLILLAVLISMITVYRDHEQAISISFIVQRGMYYVLIYFCLHIFQLSFKDIMQVVLSIVILYVFFFFITYYTQSEVISGSKQYYDVGRDVLRVYQHGILFIVFYYFYLLLKKKNTFDFFLLVILTITIFFSFTRMVIIPTLLVSLIPLLKSKYRFIFIYAFIIISVVILDEIVAKLFSMSLLSFDIDRIQNASVRFEAVDFFFTNLFKSTFSYVTGVGFASTHSEYGVFINYIKENYFYHQSDIGFVGDYTKLGIILIVSVFSIMLKIFKTKLNGKIHFIKLFWIYVAIGWVTLPFFTESQHLGILVTSLYLIDKYKELKTNQPIGRI